MLFNVFPSERRQVLDFQIIFLFLPQIVGVSELYFIMSVACVEVSDKSGELACFLFSPFVYSAELSTVYI